MLLLEVNGISSISIITDMLINTAIHAQICFVFLVKVRLHQYAGEIGTVPVSRNQCLKQKTGTGLMIDKDGKSEPSRFRYVTVPVYTFTHQQALALTRWLFAL